MPPPPSGHNLIRTKYEEALRNLAGNIRKVDGFETPVLIEGGDYAGIWLESGPLEGLLYAKHNPDVARANHDVFFHRQREDGYIPCWIRAQQTGYAQIQMVVPIAATALELAIQLKDEAFLARAYKSCSRWDAWLRRNRDTRGTGLCEAFCEWDTGHDFSPRFAGIPHECPDNNAAICPDVKKLPYLAPDLSATVYGGRVALAKMAAHLGLDSESQRWQESAETIRDSIMLHCFDPEDECFYDVDQDGQFIKIRGDALTRVLSEHVVDQALFERIYTRHIRNPESFWTPYPLPSIAIDDPAFVHDLPKNSWGGASQALTALRAPRWFEFYGKTDDLNYLMLRWVEAIARAPGFMQQMSPWTGDFSTSPEYSPAMLVFTEFVDQLGLLSQE